MSSIGCAIRAGNPSANILGWDWAESANPNNTNDFPDRITDDLLLKLANPLSFWAIIVNEILFDAFRSGLAAKDEGNRLGAALAEQIQSHGTLGAELHFIGKSHGGGVIGQAATILAEKQVPAGSLTTLDTPHIGCILSLCLIDTLKHVKPASVGHAGVYYYLQTAPDLNLRGGGFGAPVTPPYPNLTNLSLKADYADPLPKLLHLWISGYDDGACPPDNGWFPMSVWNKDVGFPTQVSFGECPDECFSSALSVGDLPSGEFVESNEQYSFDPVGACCDPDYYANVPCLRVTEDACTGTYLGDYLGDQTDCDDCPGRSALVTGEMDGSATSVMSLLAYEPFDSAAPWFGDLALLVAGVDLDDPANRVILLQELGDASFFRDVDWAPDGLLMTFDYMFREPRGHEELNVYVDNEVVYYDNADTSLAIGQLTTSGPIYVGGVADGTARLNFVLRTDGEVGGGLLLDNVRVFGFRRGDSNLDGDLDLADFAVLQRCFGEESMLPNCWRFDFDDAGDVNLVDLAMFLEFVTGPQVDQR